MRPQPITTMKEPQALGGLFSRFCLWYGSKTTCTLLGLAVNAMAVGLFIVLFVGRGPNR